MRLALTMAAIAAVCRASEAPRERRFGIDYTVSVDNLPTLADTVEIWIPVPHDDAFQSISQFDITSDYTYKIDTGEYGNRILHLKLNGALLGGRPAMLTLRFAVKRREQLVPSNKPENDRSLQHWLTPPDDTIRAAAREVADAAGAKTGLDQARALYNHVLTTADSGKGCDSGGGGLPATFINYARALGIPARFSTGLPIPRERGQGAITRPACWAEFHIEGMGWIPVDAAAAARDLSRRDRFFGTADEDRVEFSRGSELILTPRQRGEPLHYFIYPYVEVDGKPYKQVKSTFRYADLKH